MQTFIITLENIHIIFGVLLPLIIRLYKGKSFVSSVIFGWALIIIWAIIWCKMIPMILSPFVSNEILMMFPESIGILPTIMLGWLPAIALTLVAIVIVAGIKFFKKSKKL
ncbi:MAG: hypothetical protein JEZ07_04100 [Phycisphaerae bacterium]|nr:hypothetical protein [Phycisphaerae bacterium]